MKDSEARVLKRQALQNLKTKRGGEKMRTNLIHFLITGLAAIVMTWVVFLVFFGEAKQGFLEEFLQEHEAEVIGSTGNSWLLKTGEDLIELKARLNMEYLDSPSKAEFHGKTKETYIAYYEDWQKKTIKVPNKMIEEDGTIPGIAKLKRENLQPTKLGIPNKADNIILWAQTIETLIIHLMLVLAVCIGAYSGIRKLANH